jgi:hypothetical protein
MEDLCFIRGDYVRMKLSPNTRMGTVEDSKLERGHVEYLFRSRSPIVPPVARCLSQGRRTGAFTEAF